MGRRVVSCTRGTTPVVQCSGVSSETMADAAGFVPLAEMRTRDSDVYAAAGSSYRHSWSYDNVRSR